MVFNFRTPSVFYDSPEAQHTQVLTEFSSKELKAATQNFSRDNFLGMGCSGRVFRGRLRDGSLVAIKKLHGKRGFSKEHFERELEVRRDLKIQHPNVLSLRGYCRTEKELLLIYPLMINKSLNLHVGPTKRSGVQPLNWAARKQIALGVSRGLAYLHHFCDPKIIHRDVCPSNILLDQEFEAVIGDFGLARIMHQKDLINGTIECRVSVFNDIDIIEDDDNNQSTLSSGVGSKYSLYVDTYVPTAVYGTGGFLAPEYSCTGKCTLKSDVFAFGISLLNLITGRSPWYINQSDEAKFEPFILVDWVKQLMPNKLEQLMDPDLQGDYVNQEAKQLVELGLQCSHRDPRQRPEMLEVVRMIEDLGEAPRLPISNSRPLATLSRSDSDSTLYYSFSSSPMSEVAH